MTVGVGTRITLLVAIAAFALLGAGCSGGGVSVGSATFDCGDDSSSTICLESCNLGCSSTSCSRTDIAQNEVIILTFNEAVDPNSVSPSSIRFRTPSGDEPVGVFFVNGPRVEFKPTLSISGGQTFFGFTGGETYTMTILGGDDASSVVRGSSGRPFGSTLTCTLQSTLGIVDLNGVPPSARLLVPSASQLVETPLDTEIQLEFNELIDATPFLSGSQSPVAFTVRRTRPDGAGGFECDPNSQPQTLGGAQVLTFDASRDVSILNFVPAQSLPGNVCVQVSVTDGVTDLSGRSASPQVFTFRTVIVPLSDEEIVEEFDDDLHLDVEASAGNWGGGVGRFAQIGGDGRHGAFSEDLADDKDQIVDGKRLFELNCDNTIIPPENTVSGAAIAVTNGRFFFSTFVVPSDVRLRFVGSSPPILTVAGRLDVQGELELMGQSVTASAVPSFPLGQEGAVGGIFGGNGGGGGDKAIGSTPALPTHNGDDGEDLSVLAGHAYLAATANTGGRGSSVHPVSGLFDDQKFGVDPLPPGQLFYSFSSASGGGGGGYAAPGSIGQVVGIYNTAVAPGNLVPQWTQYIGSQAAGGTAMQLFPYPPATGLQRSSEHFLIGGSGGGGSGSNSTFSLSLAKSFASGAGGGGGGGALALRAGSSLRVGPGGGILASGGSAKDYIGIAASAQVAPAGGGSGGSVVLQTSGLVEIAGPITVEGGLGGLFRRQASTGVFPNYGLVNIDGGNGSPGFVRLEAPITPPLTALGSVVPGVAPDSVGQLIEVDDLVSVRSRYYSTNLIFGPEFSRYEIEATVDGQPVVFSDDISISPVAAGLGSALRVLFQAADIDVATGEVLSVRPWRSSVRSSANQIGIASDGLNGYRFMLFVDRTVASEVTVERLKVVYRN